MKLTQYNDWYATDTYKKYFYNEVFRNNVQAAVIHQVNKIREGERVPDDGTALKNVLCVLQELGIQCYIDLEWAILENASTYYSTKTSSWRGGVSKFKKFN